MKEPSPQYFMKHLPL